MRRTLSITLAGLSMCLSAPAAADHFHATRSSKLVEWSHTVHLTWHRGYADLVVQRTAYNGGARHDQASYTIDLPPGAVATRLRTMAPVNGEPRWYEGELLEAETAAARYLELTGIGGMYPKDPALLSWRTQDRLALQVFPCPPGEQKTVEYTLRIPTTYEAGQERLELPPLGTEDVPPTLFVRAADAGDSVVVHGRPVAPGEPLVLDVPLALSMSYGQSALLEGSMASVPVNADVSLSHLRIDAADALSTVPAGAWVVVVVDASKSYGPDRVQASGAALADYLIHFQQRGAKVRVATFDRTVHPLGSGFDSVSTAVSTLRKLPVQVANGSHLDAAFEFAKAELQQAPPGAPRRVIVTTDFQTRAAVTPERLEATSRQLGAAVHLASVRSGPTSLHRDDDSSWARVARSTGGVLWHASVESKTSPEQREVFEEWARPVRIDRLSLAAVGEPIELSLPDSLAEGGSIEHTDLARGPSYATLLEGELWSTPIQKAMLATPTERRKWAGLLFGTEFLPYVTEEDQMPLAMLGGVVSPVTSYLAIEPGVRPSTEGLEEGEGGGAGMGIGLGSIGTMGWGAGSGSPAELFDRSAWLSKALSAQRKHCGMSVRAQVGIETTQREVVEVVVAAPNASAASAACMVEAGWGLDLPEGFLEPYERFDLVVE